MNKINTYGTLLINYTGLARILNSKFYNNTGGTGCAIFYQASSISSSINIYVFKFLYYPY